MELIQNNPYRIAGVFSNATEKELLFQKEKIIAYARMKRETESELDFKFLKKISRANLSTVEKVFSALQQNQDKVNFALFWFCNTNQFDNTAIEYLKNGDEEKAVEIWKEITLNEKVNSNNFSTFNNFGIYKLLSKSQIDIRDGIEAKIKLIESKYFKNFVHSVTGETFTIDNKKQLQKMIDELLKQFRNRFSNAETFQLFNHWDCSKQKYFSQVFINESIHRIENQIKSNKNKREENKDNANKFGFELYENCKDDLFLLKSLLDHNNSKHKMISDNLAKEILQCSIDYLNENRKEKSNNNCLEDAIKLTKLADRVAVNKKTQNSIKENIDALETINEEYIDKAIAILNSIRNTYKQNKTQIIIHFREQELSLNSGQSINWNKVDNLISNSINWDKTVELVKEIIPQQDINQIRLSNNLAKINEFKSLADFLLVKLNTSQKNEVKYLCYWKSIDTTPTNNSTTIHPSPINHDDCYITTTDYGDKNPKVIELQKFKDEFIDDAIIGRGFIKFYNKYSRGLVERLKNRKNISLVVRERLKQFIQKMKR